MPRAIDGNYTLPAGTLVSTGDTVQPSQHNPAMSDIATALTNSLARNGSGAMLTNLDMGGFKLINTQIDFVQTGSGAVMRDYQAKLREWVSPADFGAVGDSNENGSSGTNDASAFALLEAAHADKLVNLNGKFYLVNSPIPHKNQYFNGMFVVAQSTTDDQPTNLGEGYKSLAANSYVPRQFPSAGPNYAAGNYNTGFGYIALRANTSGRRNTAFGSNAMANSTVGFYNTAIGSWTAVAAGLGNYNTCVGVQSLQFCTGNSNTAVGVGAGNGIVANDDNTCVGHDAGTGNGSRGTYLGRQAGWKVTGAENIAIGYQALSNPTPPTGNYNIAIGSGSGGTITTGAFNTLIGRRSGATFNANRTVGVGSDALVSATTNADDNTAIGYNTLSSADGARNTGVGSGAGNTLTTGSNVGCFGYNAQPSSATAVNEITLGNGSIASLRCATTTITAVSDRRYKQKIAPLKLGLDFINDVQIRSFEWNGKSGRAKGDRDVGIIAQELQDVATKHGADWLGLVDASDPDRLEATPGKLLFPLLRAVQELSARVVALEAK